MIAGGEQNVPLILGALFSGVEQNVPQHAQALITSLEGGEQNVPYILRALISGVEQNVPHHAQALITSLERTILAMRSLVGNKKFHSTGAQ